MTRGILAAAITILVFSAAHADPLYWAPEDSHVDARDSVSVPEPEIHVVIDGPLNPFNPDREGLGTHGNSAAFPGLVNSGTVNVVTDGGAHPVPESGTLVLLSVGLVSVLGARRRIFK